MKKVKSNILILFFSLGFFFQAMSQTLQWAKQYGITSPTSYDQAISKASCVDSSGNTYILGDFNGTLQINLTTLTSTAGIYFPNRDIYINKFNKNGILVWTKQINNYAAQGSLTATHMAVDPQGNIIITGTFYKILYSIPTSYGGSLGDGINGHYFTFIIKIKPNGSYAWGNAFNLNEVTSINQIKTDILGNVYCTGQFNGQVDFNLGSNIDTMNSSNGNQFILKLDSNGLFQWTHQLKKASITSITFDEIQNVYASGHFSDTADFNNGTGVDTLIGNTNDFYYLKLNSSAQFEWVKSIRAGTSTSFCSRALEYNHHGSLISMFCHEGPIDFDPSIDTFFLSGKSTTISKIDTNGTFDWAKQIVSHHSNYPPQFSSVSGIDLKVDVQGDIYSSGYVYSIDSSPIDFNPGLNDYPILYSYNWIWGNHMYVHKLDSMGTFKWAEPFRGASPTSMISISNLGLDTLNNVYISGVIQAEYDFNPTNLNYSLTPNNGFVYLFKLGQCGSNYYQDINFCDSILVGTNHLHSDSTILQIYSTVDGCDSNLVINYKMYPSINNTQTIIACDSVQIGSTTYTSSGNYIVNSNSVNGCDSNTIYHLTIHTSTDTSFIIQHACNSYTFNGQTYTTSGIYNSFVTIGVGCDSLVILNLTIDTTINNTYLVDTACQLYLWNSTYYTMSGTYNQTFASAAGCDSVTTLNLTILHNSSFSYSATACQSYTFFGTTYHSSGVYNSILSNSVGCDSVIYLNLTIDSISIITDSFMTVAACNTSTINGITYTASGNYIQMYINSHGCDSTLYIDLNLINLNTICLQLGPSLTAYALPANYQWVTCPSFTPISGATNQLFTASANGDYAVILYQSGCIDTSICYTVTDVGINQFSSSSMNISPNPTSNNFNIQLEHPIQNASLKIISLTGDILLLKNNLNGPQFNIDVSSFANGLYIIELKDEHHILRSKIRKE